MSHPQNCSGFHRYLLGLLQIFFFPSSFKRKLKKTLFIASIKYLSVYIKKTPPYTVQGSIIVLLTMRPLHIGTEFHALVILEGLYHCYIAGTAIFLG